MSRQVGSPRERNAVVSVIETSVNRNCGIVSGGRGYALGNLTSSEGNSGVKDKAPGVGRGAAHSNTRGEENKSIDSLLDYRESTGREGAEEGKRDRRRNLGSQELQVLPSRSD